MISIQHHRTRTKQITKPFNTCHKQPNRSTKTTRIQLTNDLTPTQTTPTIITMATTYAAYGNVMAHGAQPQNHKSTRSSVSSTASSTAPAARKSRWQRFVDELKPIEEPQAPISIYGPLVYEKKPKHQSHTQSSKQERQSSSRRASEIYTGFKNKVGGEKVNFYG